MRSVLFSKGLRPPISEKPPLDRVQELFDFLQGVVPDGHEIAAELVPHLSPDQAWTVVWFLGNCYWQIPDHIERCDVCGELFDSHAAGGYVEDGPPYHFCEPCWDQRYLDELDEAAIAKATD